MRTKPYSINRTKFLSDEELAYLELILERHKGSRDALLIEVALNTGGRASEVLAITKGDLNPIKRTVFLRGLKGSDDGDIPLKQELFERLYSFAMKQTSNRVFDISYQRLVQIWNCYRPNNKTFHTLRHTSGIRLYLKTKDIKLVQMFLRHRNLANTEVYLKYLYKEDELLRILE